MMSQSYFSNVMSDGANKWETKFLTPSLKFPNMFFPLKFKKKNPLFSCDLMTHNSLNTF